MLLGAIAFAAPCARAQISLTTAVDLALRTDPRVKIAQSDLDLAMAKLAEAHDVFVPSITTEGGVGKSVGVPLGLPVVYSIAAQSLAFNFSQRDYIRAAHAGVAAAEFALGEVRDTTAMDAVNTYVSLDSALQRKAALAQASGLASRITRIVEDRFDAGLETRIEVTRSKRTTAQLRLQQLRVEDEIAALSAHLARLTGLGGTGPETIHDSIPEFKPTSIPEAVSADSYGIRAALANATAKQEIARGDARYRLRPQLAFAANYSRIDTAFTNYAQYYRGFNTDVNGNQRNSFNSLNIGIQISVPILDLIHQAKARGSAAEAAHARFQAESDRNQFLEGRLKLQHAAAELSARAEVASLNRDLAQDEMDAIHIQLQSDAAANGQQTPLSPKDEQNARLQERQRYLEFLDADLELRQTEINLLKQNGQLGVWLHGAVAAPGVTPAAHPPSSALPTAPTIPR